MTDIIKYKSKFAYFPFVIFSFGVIFFGLAGFKLMIDWSNKFGLSLLLLLPSLFIFMSVVSLIGLISLKTIMITEDYLILKYIFSQKTVRIKWKSIIDVKMKFAATKTSADDNIFRTGSEIKIYTAKSSFEVLSFFYKDFDKFLIQSNKRLDSRIKSKMKKGYKAEKQSFWKNERRYWDIQYRFVLPICITILIIIFLLNK
ncbi:hypothetical protein [Marinifilum fragile]|uniref:hypothetical protein n=1 Tax=Marinifilum fragile TaxID=570161 RepID=UPI002AA81E32|nr:hypothetical protein [Marinifilum fragile]